MMFTLLRPYLIEDISNNIHSQNADSTYADTLSSRFSSPQQACNPHNLFLVVCKITNQKEPGRSVSTYLKSTKF